MGLSPPASFPQTLPPSSSSSHPRPFSTVADSFLTYSERDIHILTQALTHDLSSAPGSSPSFVETLRRYGLEGEAFWQSPETLSVVRALQQQQRQQQKQAAAMSSVRLRQDGFLHTELNPLQKGSNFSSNSPSPISAPRESPGSPFSTLSTSSNISMANTIGSESLLAHINPNNQDPQDGVFTSKNTSHKASEMSNLYSNSFLSSRTASIALSSQASVGAGGGKVSKRRSRASNRNPIAVISADATNFRAMVQQLTGVPSPPSIHPYGSSGMPLLKPHPIRHPSTYTCTTHLPTLDTSACFLGPKPITKNPLQGYSNVQRPLQMSQSPLSATDLTQGQGRHVDSTFQSSLPLNFKRSAIGEQAYPINCSISSSAPTLPSLWDSADDCKPREDLPSLSKAQQFPVRQASGAVESLIMEEHVVPKSQYNNVDSWLSFDHMELARMA